MLKQKSRGIAFNFNTHCTKHLWGKVSDCPWLTMLRPGRGLTLMLALMLAWRLVAIGNRNVLFVLVSYLADSRQGATKIPGETPGMGQHGGCVTAACQRKGSSGHTDKRGTEQELRKQCGMNQVQRPERGERSREGARKCGGAHSVLTAYLQRQAT